MTNTTTTARRAADNTHTIDDERAAPVSAWAKHYAYLWAQPNGHLWLAGLVPEPEYTAAAVRRRLHPDDDNRACSPVAAR